MLRCTVWRTGSGSPNRYRACAKLEEGIRQPAVAPRRNPLHSASYTSLLSLELTPRSMLNFLEGIHRPIPEVDQGIDSHLIDVYAAPSVRRAVPLSQGV